MPFLCIVIGYTSFHFIFYCIDTTAYISFSFLISWLLFVDVEIGVDLVEMLQMDTELFHSTKDQSDLFYDAVTNHMPPFVHSSHTRLMD